MYPSIWRRGLDVLVLACFIDLSALVGALLLLASDLIAQHVLPLGLPVGVVTVSVGGLYLVVMIIKEIRRRA
ncbi:iron chelate uptake ABC transporter family permease subunit [Dietzia psychralcaliphila]|uniref:iron chelate uptake ABC transporter family permease subunit n=1 Tax=Dietzia psychralcaliphila TaxID=139021 RepID=UPI001C1E6943|nr:iron chelate uptake ABC transporter family permease subunit [Dietzia psychralcaliphila]